MIILHVLYLSVNDSSDMSSDEICFNPSYCYSQLQHCYYYAIGNSPAKDLTEGCPVPDEPSFLLLGCGDIRNILFTTAECSHLKRTPRSLEFNINDIDEVCLARDAILLSILDSINPEIPGDVEFLWSVWYNLHLEKQEKLRLNSLMNNFLEHSGDLLEFPDAASRKKLHDVIKQWTDMSISCTKVLKLRERSLTKMRKEQSFESALSIILSRSCDIQLPEQSIIDTRWKDEYENYFRHGSCKENVQDDNTCVNPTLWCPRTNDWRVHYASRPFISYNFLL